MTPAAVVDRGASLAAFGDWERPMLKHRADLDRYAHLIWTTRPKVVVETGTRTGHSAAWFACQPGVDMVVTVDITHRRVDRTDLRQNYWGRIEWVEGPSTDPDVVAHVTQLVADRTCLVSLDSDHAAAHVAAEIRAYAPLVTPGCHLVVEDGITAWLDRATRRKHVGRQIGDPVDAIAATVAVDPRFERDTAIEAMSAVSMHPAGWWRRR